MSDKGKIPSVALPRAVDQELKAFVRSFIMYVKTIPSANAITGNAGAGAQGKDTGTRRISDSSRAANRPQVLQRYRNNSGAACPPRGGSVAASDNNGQLLGPHKSDFVSAASHHDLNPTDSQIRNSYHCCYCIEGKGMCKCSSLDDFDVNSPSLAMLAPEQAGEGWWHTEKSREHLNEFE
ncbi:hypothetical protein RvY_11492 [Ramazzottius varieornatus]|uniref:Uncharacterized protein n=1 Tax=Ramazzottius varieornatus TaxID=947166 RepID=A0A1D1VP19_RAMVA|nr:hypothetical protein RvY_11492 [Ramazzottius varieornatus]